MPQSSHNKGANASPSGLESRAAGKREIRDLGKRLSIVVDKPSPEASLLLNLVGPHVIARDGLDVLRLEGCMAGGKLVS